MLPATRRQVLTVGSTRDALFARSGSEMRAHGRQGNRRLDVG
jgi:hypothetical protein